MPDANCKKPMEALISQIRDEAASIQDRIAHLEAERGPMPELDRVKACLRVSQQIDPGMTAEEIRLLLLKPSGGAQ